MSSADCSFKVLASPAAGELLQSHNSLLFKLLKTGESWRMILLKMSLKNSFVR